MLSLGIDASLALRTAFSSAALPLGSPPPSRAATMMARASLENCAPRRESTTAFLCLMLAHLECPDMARILRTQRARRPPPGVVQGAPARRMSYRVSATAAPEIFKAYDIRGVYPEQLDGPLAERIGRAFANVLASLSDKPPGELRVGLGHDMRLSAPELSARYAEGLLDAGADVIDIGEVGSEMLYYLVGSRALDGGLMCTASHNPKTYTGAKLVREGALALSGDSGIAQIRRAVEESSANGASAPAAEEPPSAGAMSQLDIYEEFQDAA